MRQTGGSMDRPLLDPTLVAVAIDVKSIGDKKPSYC